jgi:hypothetical protein
MSYARVNTSDADDHYSASSPVPNSPPPSFRSQTTSPILLSDPLRSDAQNDLHDAFDSPSDDESDNEDGRNDDSRRLVRNDTVSTPVEGNGAIALPVERRVAQIPVVYSGRTVGGGNVDGVFANLSAKPTRGEELEEKPPVRTQHHMRTHYS